MRSWVMRVTSSARQLLPVFTQDQTYRYVAPSGAMGQVRRFALQKNSEPFDDHVGSPRPSVEQPFRVAHRREVLLRLHRSSTAMAASPYYMVARKLPD